MDTPTTPISTLRDYTNVTGEITLHLPQENSFLANSPLITRPTELSLQRHPVQAPTPQGSAPNSPLPMPLGSSNGDDCTTVSVSTAFHPGAHGALPDTILTSSEGVLFYVSSEVLKSGSRNAFSKIFEESAREHHGLIERVDRSTPQRIISVPETSAVLNVILHLLYGTSVARHSPTFETLTTTVDHLSYYGLEPKNFVFPRAPLYKLLLAYAPLFPLPLYTLAGHHGLHDLAVATSSHLLSCPLTDITDDTAERMGPLYLKKIMCLHLERFLALKRILLQPPHPHPASRECSFVDQKKLTRAWALVAAYLAWDTQSDLSTHDMRSAFQSLAGDITCELCQQGLEERLKDTISQWASTRRTI